MPLTMADNFNGRQPILGNVEQPRQGQLTVMDRQPILGNVERP